MRIRSIVKFANQMVFDDVVVSCFTFDHRESGRYRWHAMVADVSVYTTLFRICCCCCCCWVLFLLIAAKSGMRDFRDRSEIVFFVYVVKRKQLNHWNFHVFNQHDIAFVWWMCLLNVFVMHICVFLQHDIAFVWFVISWSYYLHTILIFKRFVSCHKHDIHDSWILMSCALCT